MVARPPPDRRRPPWPLLIAGALVLVAVALLPALVHERRLQSATAALATDPVAALREARSAEAVGTLQRARETELASLVDLRRYGDAERLIRVLRRRTPRDPMLLRSQLEVEVLAHRRAAARRTLARLRTVDPRYAAGTGQ